MFCGLAIFFFFFDLWALRDLKEQPHLFVAQVSLVEGDAGQLVALTDVKHRNRVASVQQLLHQVSAQETGPPDDRTPFTTLYQNKRGAITDKHKWI